MTFIAELPPQAVLVQLMYICMITFIFSVAAEFNYIYILEMGVNV
jgi:hypothetical protein